MDLLEALTDQPRSGEAIAADLGVSRAAVSKAARLLQDRGYPVVVDRMAGYSFPPGSPTPTAFAAARTGRFGAPYHYLGNVESTQEALRALTLDGAPQGTVVLGETQTAGRGRRGRSWESRPGRALTFSVLLHPSIPVSSLGLLSLAAGVALADAPGADSVVKWPNDLLAPDGRKLAGVLAESQTSAEEVASVILGIGINVHGPAPSGGAAVDEFDPTVRRVDLLASILQQLEHWTQVASDEPAQLIEAWCERSSMIGLPVVAQTASGAVTGQAEGLDSTGALLIRTDDGVIPVHAGDVTQLMKETT